MDWINSKLYWTDVRTRWIGVMDLNSYFHKKLFMTAIDAYPREIVLDPTTRFVYINISCVPLHNYAVGVYACS